MSELSFNLSRKSFHPTVAIAALIVAGTAHAQVVGADQVADTGDIVVTAQKRQQSLQDVPLSMTAVSAESLESKNVRSLSGLQDVTPNLRFVSSTGTPQVYVRGVGGGGRNVGFNPRVGIYVDGVYMGDTGSLDAVLVGLERIEVLRGPQGFLFGENSDAGAISLVTKAPGPDPSASASVAYGSLDRLELTGRINMPLTDNLFASVAGVRNTRDGDVTNVFNGEKLNKVDNWGVRGRVRYQPSTEFTLDLAADYSRLQNNLIIGERLTDIFGATPSTLPRYTVNEDIPERDDRPSYGLSATASYVGDDFALTSITAYRKSKRSWATDNDHGPTDIIKVAYKDDYSTFSQELRLASVDDKQPLRYLAGLYFSQISSSSNRQSFFGTGGAAFGLPVGTSISANPELRARNYAAFASVDYDLAPELTVTIAGRISREAKRIRAAQSGDPRVGVATGIVFFSGYSDNRSETYFTPMAGLQYKPNDDVMLYARYSGGTKGGGFNADFITRAAPNQRPYEYSAENVDSFEVGVKSEFLDKRVRLNLSVYLNDFTDYQLFQYQQTPGALLGTPLLTNAGKVRTYGPELDLTVAPVPGLTLNFSGAWLYAKYKRFENGGGLGIDYSGNRLEYAPRWSLSTGADYTTSMAAGPADTAFASILYAYRSSQFGDASNAARYEIRPMGLLDATIGVGGALGATKWEFSIAGRNLFDVQQLNNISIDGFGVLMGFRQQRRSFLAKLKFDY